jgi:hypothetical protein
VGDYSERDIGVNIVLAVAVASVNEDMLVLVVYDIDYNNRRIFPSFSLSLSPGPSSHLFRR